MVVLQPTILPAFPAHLVMLYQTIQATLKGASGCTYWFVDKCVTSKLTALEKDGSTTSMLADAAIFSKIKSMIGGKVRLMLTGGVGPVPGEILKFMKICLCT